MQMTEINAAVDFLQLKRGNECEDKVGLIKVQVADSQFFGVSLTNRSRWAIFTRLVPLFSLYLTAQPSILK